MPSSPIVKADLLFYQRIDYEDGAIVEMVIWRVPLPVKPATHDFKYSLFYGGPGGREVGTTMSAGKVIIGISKALRRPTRSAPSSS